MCSTRQASPDLRYPITIHLADGSQHATVAKASFAASVPPMMRGVHMSRFVESLHAWRNRIGVSTSRALLARSARATWRSRGRRKIRIPSFPRAQGAGERRSCTRRL